MKLQILIIPFCLFLLPLGLYAQRLDRFESADNHEEEEYEQEFVYGINWNTNGGIIGGINLKYAWQRKDSQLQYHLIGLELVALKHPKEVTVIDNTTGLSYIFGKQSEFYVIRPHFGHEFIVFRKAEEEGIQISLIGAIGPSLGYRKPYYVYYGDTLINVTAQPYQPSMPSSKIYGGAGYFNGFDQMTAHLGAHSKVSVNFEYGQFKNSVAGIEVGALAEIYKEKIIMIPQAQNRSFFLSFFINIYFGLR